MREQVERTIAKYGMIRPDAVVVAAVSGGRDSMALLHVLRPICAHAGVKLVALHLNHGLREGADAERRLVEAYAKNLGVAFLFEELRVDDNRHKGESMEMAARRLRYDAYRRALKPLGEHSVVATAHHQRDQAETVLMRLLRGSGTRGLAGIDAVRRPFVRPMLFVSYDDIRCYVSDNAIPYQEDESNWDVGILRNRIRHNLLPKLAHEYNPNVERALAAAAQAAREDEAFLAALTERSLGEIQWFFVPGIAVTMRGDAFLSLAVPLQKRALRRAVEALGSFHAEQAQLERALLAIERGGAQQLSAGVMVRGGHHVQVYKKVKPASERAAVEAGVKSAIGPFIIEASIGPVQRWDDAWGVCVDAGISRGLSVRTRRSGDRFHGARGTKKLGDAMTDGRVPPCLRDHLPVVFCGDTALWAPGLEIARRFLPSDPSHCLRIRVRTAANGAADAADDWV